MPYSAPGLCETRVKDGNPADGEKNQGKSDEILRLPHPVDIDAVKEFHAESRPSTLTPRQLGFVPGDRLSLRLVLVLELILNAQLLLPLHARQVKIKNRSRHVNRSEHVSKQADHQRDGKTLYGPSTEQE